MNVLPKPLTSAIRLILGITLTTSPAWAWGDQPHMEEIEVRALGIKERADRIASPYSIVDDKTLLRQGGGSLGNALNGQPGVHADTFGGGASRPVIRGQTAPRVTVLADGSLNRHQFSRHFPAA